MPAGKRLELLEIRTVEPGLGLEDAHGCRERVLIFIDVHPSPGQRPVAGVRRLLAPRQRHVQGLVPQGQETISTVTMGCGCSGIRALS